MKLLIITVSALFTVAFSKRLITDDGNILQTKNNSLNDQRPSNTKLRIQTYDIDILEPKLRATEPYKPQTINKDK